MLLPHPRMLLSNIIIGHGYVSLAINRLHNSWYSGIYSLNVSIISISCYYVSGHLALLSHLGQRKIRL